MTGFQHFLRLSSLFLCFDPEQKLAPHEKPCGANKYLSADLPGGQILAHHQRHLKDDGMVKLAQVQAGKLLDLLQTVHQGVTVDKQLTGGFRNI